MQAQPRTPYVWLQLGTLLLLAASLDAGRALPGHEARSGRRFLTYNTSWIVPDRIVYTSRAPEQAHCSGPHELDIVISSYNEKEINVTASITRVLSYPNVARAKPCIYLYDKGPRDYLSLTAIPHLYQIIKEVNVGREGQSMLKYIIHHYHQLPLRVLFMQAIPNWEEVFWGRLPYLGTNTGFLPLGQLAPNPCDGWFTGHLVRLRELWALFREELCEGPFMGAHNGQLVVSSKRILKHSQQKYILVLSYLFAPKDHHIHKDLEAEPKAQWVKEYDNNNPLLLHTLERAWSFMWDCKEVAMFNGCCNPGYLVPGCNYNCQCLDKV